MNSNSINSHFSYQYPIFTNSSSNNTQNVNIPYYSINNVAINQTNVSNFSQQFQNQNHYLYQNHEIINDTAQTFSPVKVVNRNCNPEPNTYFSQPPFQTSSIKAKSKIKKIRKSTANQRSNASQRSHLSTAKFFNQLKCNFPIQKLYDFKFNPNIVSYLNNIIYPSIEIKKYSTSALSTNMNYLTVYQYKVNNQYIIWDYDTGLVHLTGMWKASILNANTSIDTRCSVNSCNLKADIVKLVESTPKRFQPYIKRIRGGFLKIQGTWMPYKLCRILAKRFCYNIRYELIPIFGPDFPEYCLKPNEVGFGELKFDQMTREEEFDLQISLAPIEEKPVVPNTVSYKMLPTPQQSTSISPVSSSNFSIETPDTFSNSYQTQLSGHYGEKKSPQVESKSQFANHPQAKTSNCFFNQSSSQTQSNFQVTNKNVYSEIFPYNITKTRRKSESISPLQPISPQFKTKLPLPMPSHITPLTKLPSVNSLDLNPINHVSPYSPISPKKFKRSDGMHLISPYNLDSINAFSMTTKRTSEYDDIVNASKCLQSFKKNSISSILIGRLNSYDSITRNRASLDSENKSGPSFAWQQLESNYTSSSSLDFNSSRYLKVSNTRQTIPKKLNPLKINDLIT